MFRIKLELIKGDVLLIYRQWPVHRLKGSKLVSKCGVIVNRRVNRQLRPQLTKTFNYIFTSNYLFNYIDK